MTAVPLGFLLDGKSDPEQASRLRELRALAMVFAGRAHPATRALSMAVADRAAAPDALAEITRLPPLS